MVAVRSKRIISLVHWPLIPYEIISRCSVQAYWFQLAPVVGSCLLRQLQAFEGGILLDLPREIDPSHVKFTRGERTVARVGGSSLNRFAHLLCDTSTVGSHTAVLHVDLFGGGPVTIARQPV
jgi:hypothetical protein